jgi:hypothetical protein
MHIFYFDLFCSDCGSERIYPAHRGETGPGLEIPPLDRHQESSGIHQVSVFKKKGC